MVSPLCWQGLFFMVVYFHRNPVTYEIFYVGIGSSIRRARRIFGNRTTFYENYVKKHGRPIIQLVHDNLTREQAIQWEIFYIKLLGKRINGGQLLNFSDGGEGAVGVHWSEERKLAFGNIHRGSKRSDESKRRMSQWQKGKKLTEEHKRKLSETCRTKNEVKRLANPVKKKKLKKPDSKLRPVIMFHPKSGKYIASFESLRSAARFFNCKSPTSIFDAINGRLTTAHSYKWEYA